MEWLDAVEKSLPTLVFSAKDAAGHDLLDVRVTVDGQPLLSTLDGAAVPVDPGPHTFRFEQPGGASATLQILVKEGAKNVEVPTVLSRPPPPPAEPPAAPPRVTVRRPEPSHGLRTFGLIVGGVGIAGLGAGAVTGLLAMSTWSTAKKECPTHTGCSQQAMNDQTQASGLATASTVGFAAGGVLAAVGVTLLLAAPTAQEGRVGVVLGPGALGVAGEF
jgi:hypothetical protein